MLCTFERTLMGLVTWRHNQLGHPSCCGRIFGIKRFMYCYLDGWNWCGAMWGLYTDVEALIGNGLVWLANHCILIFLLRTFSGPCMHCGGYGPWIDFSCRGSPFQLSHFHRLLLMYQLSAQQTSKVHCLKYCREKRIILRRALLLHRSMRQRGDHEASRISPTEASYGQDNCYSGNPSSLTFSWQDSQLFLPR